MYFAEGAAEDAAVYKFKTALPAYVLVVAGRKHEVLAFLIAEETS
jgi:hypothetical protein